ncbi:hypothetical protein SDC9_21232 [bioreactor metagenome]|uniref:Response regulatory domain-containing protein n=1 Tax=bioreactor metagenome TaxID=1076179 RepID=A0A644U8Y2_9ZZZZ|nr:response regulator [Methanobrevibacter sp.]MEA4957977.1 response regulator [Methanobrevibacter sp.]
MRKSILIVEDDKFTANDLKNKLESIDYKVLKIVSTGDEGIDIAVEKRPDLILIDINLKGNIDCIEVSQKLSALDLPVLFIADKQDLIDNKNIKNLSVDTINSGLGFIFKPIDTKKLNNSIEIAINNHKIETEKLNLAMGVVKDKQEDNSDKKSAEKLNLKASERYYRNKENKKVKNLKKLIQILKIF